MLNAFIWQGWTEVSTWTKLCTYPFTYQYNSGIILRSGSTCFWLRCVQSWCRMLYLCTWNCHRVLVCAQAKVHLCRFVWLHSRQCPLTSWHCPVVDNMTVGGTKAAIPEIFESTLKHEIFAWRLSRVSLADFVLGIAVLVQNRKRGLFGGVVITIRDNPGRGWQTTRPKHIPSR